MNLLLANDDGYDASGLKILADRLSKEHNVYIVAPHVNRSAVSHHITMFNPTEIRQISDRVWACCGFPSDCACIGLVSDLFDVKFDALISGINCGPNLGTDILYSGTCAAARQAVLNNVPGIAVSLDPLDWKKAEKEGFKYEPLADFVAKNIEKLISLCSLENPRCFVNVNGPSLESYKGARLVSELCVRKYNDRLKIVREDDAVVSHFMMGNSEAPGAGEDCDYTVVRNGCVAVSVVRTDPVCIGVNGIEFSV